MPDYEYECMGCGDVRVIKRAISEQEQTYICDQCDSEYVRKWTAPAFKPSPGMYSHDNRR